MPHEIHVFVVISYMHDPCIPVYTVYIYPAEMDRFCHCWFLFIHSVLCRSTLWKCNVSSCPISNGFEQRRDLWSAAKSSPNSSTAEPLWAPPGAVWHPWLLPRLLPSFKYRIHNFTTRHNYCQCGLNTPARPWRIVGWWDHCISLNYLYILYYLISKTYIIHHNNNTP